MKHSGNHTLQVWVKALLLILVCAAVFMYLTVRPPLSYLWGFLEKRFGRVVHYAIMGGLLGGIGAWGMHSFSHSKPDAEDDSKGK